MIMPALMFCATCTGVRLRVSPATCRVCGVWRVACAHTRKMKEKGEERTYLAHENGSTGGRGSHVEYLPLARIERDGVQSKY